jgi:hypothetical protein
MRQQDSSLMYKDSNIKEEIAEKMQKFDIEELAENGGEGPNTSSA